MDLLNVDSSFRVMTVQNPTNLRKHVKRKHPTQHHELLKVEKGDLPVGSSTKGTVTPGSAA